MNDKQLDDLHEIAAGHVKIGCCENHPHTALEGCLTGDNKDITICKLIEVIRHERRVIREAVERLGKS